MGVQGKQQVCDVYITPDERMLLARVARYRGVGRDYLALRRRGALERPAAGRPLPRWLGKAAAMPAKPLTQDRERAPVQARHCRSCVHLAPCAAGSEQRVCGAGVWTHPMLAQSVLTSRRVRALSLTCSRYVAASRPPRATQRRCRTCQELMAADTIDRRFVCGRGVWTNPMIPLSVANARRLARLSAACPHFRPRADRALPRA